MAAQNLTPAVQTAFIELDWDTVGWSTFRRTVTAAREYTWTASHARRIRRLVLIGGDWCTTCWKCDGSGNIGYGPHNGVCYGCDGYGTNDSWATGDSFEAKLVNVARNVQAESTKNRRAAEEAAAITAAWREANADIIAWAQAMTPSRLVDVDSYVQIEDTREAAEHTPRPDTDRIQASKELEDGRWWTHFVIQNEEFNGYSSAVQENIARVRFGSGLDPRNTGLLRKVMADEAPHADEAAASRHAGAPAARLTLTGKVVKVEERGEVEGIVDYLFIKVEGVGADTGLTWVTNTSSKTAWDLEEGQFVSVKATVKKNEVYQGIKSDRVGRAVFTVVTEPKEAPVTAPTPEPAPAAETAPAKPASVPVQAQPKPARATRRESQGESVVDGWDLLYDKPRAKAQIVRKDGAYGLVCTEHKTVTPLARLTDEREIRNAGGWCCR